MRGVLVWGFDLDVQGGFWNGLCLCFDVMIYDIMISDACGAVGLEWKRKESTGNRSRAFLYRPCVPLVEEERISIPSFCKTTFR